MNFSFRFIVFSLHVVLLASPVVAGTFVYVSESRDNRIAVFSLHEENGKLERIGEVELEGSPGCLWLDSSRSRIYASVRSTAQFATLTIDPDSGLLKLEGTAKSAGSAAYLYPDKTNKWLLAAYYGDGTVSVNRIESGVVIGEPVQVMEVGKKAHCIQTDPANRFAFCPHTGELNQVTQFRFDAESGELVLNDPKVLKAGDGQGPRHLQFHPNGKWVYQVNEQGKSVTLCDYDAGEGTLTMRQTVSTIPDDWPADKGSCADIEISADGRFVYASNRGHDSIAVFAIDEQTGEISSRGQTPTGKTPRSFNLIEGGENFLVAAGQGADNLVVYRRDTASGKLTELKRYDCGRSPAWVLGVKK
ncbi:MAG: lactonase family protein [Verrucomicrobiales bacterium]|nr:lactonase family protein [Verrucomicrobiales bacterium]